MPIIRPFRGLRYDSEVADEISKNVAPPYDIIYDEWSNKLHERSPHNIIRLIKPRDEQGDTETVNKYNRAARYLDTWIHDGILRIDDDPAIYFRADTYQVNGETKTRYGFIALLKIEEFGRNVHPHERTLSAPKVDRLNLVKATGANLSQVFSVYRDPHNEIHDIILKKTGSEPDISFIDEQDIFRRMWVVKEPEIISALRELMKGRDVIIADGHHRYETALAYKSLMESKRKNDDEPFDYVSMYFSSADAPGMTILPTHRKVSGVSTYNQKTFFTELKKLFDITFLGESDIYEVMKIIAKDSEHNNCFGIYTCDGFGTARFLRPSIPKELDVDILHNIIIEKLLGISRTDIESGQHVHFCKSPEHAIEDVAYNSDQISFIMNALSPDEIFHKVLQGVRMPQKSTYFYPKTMSGLVMYKIDKQSLG